MFIKPLGSSFAGSPYYDGSLNALDVMVMQGEQDFQAVLAQFENAINMGYDPNLVKDECFANAGVDSDDWSQAKCNRLIKEVERMYKQKHY